MTLPQHKHFMQHAIRLGERNLGQTGARPSVGCVIVKNGAVIAATCTGTEAENTPHAEALALASAGENARGATLYTTLEPCSHIGRNGACATAIIEAGITRVVIACTDPNALVAGQGIAMLRAANIEVTENICAEQAEALHASFFRHIQTTMPTTTLKIATSADGMMATKTGHSKWITGELARNRAHVLRAQHDAILTGIGTALADDPMLNCRLAGRESHSPIRIVLDRQLRLPITSKLVQRAGDIPLWIITEPADGDAHKAAYKALAACAGIEIIAAPKDASMRDIITLIGARGISRLMIEAGPTLSGAFLREQCIDDLYWFRSPHIIGANGMAAFPNMDIDTMQDAQNMQIAHEEILGNDRLTHYRIV